MTLKEKREQRKASMSPFRWKILTVGLPLYVLLLLFPAPIIIGLLAAKNDAGIIVAYAWIPWMVLVNVAAFVLLALATKVDVKIEMERFSYLFKEPEPFEEESLTVTDEDLVYTLDKDGVQLEFPDEEAGQVFDEAKENVFYIPWERAEFALASQSINRRVYLAIAVFAMDDDLVPFFIPLDEKVFAFMKKTGLDKKMDGNWTYLTYNPENAFKQLVTKGRIVKMYNKKTGKLFVDGRGNFIGDE